MMKKISKAIFNIIWFIWQLPQNLIGLLISKRCIYSKSFNKYKVFITDYGEGMSLGKYIFVNYNCPEGNLLKHEFGHCIQSNILGWLYMIVIFIPSYCWWLYFSTICKNQPDEEYYYFYTELWANHLVSKRKRRRNLIKNIK